jgi:drug/metabolite transporter (DMT)-like permease
MSLAPLPERSNDRCEFDMPMKPENNHSSREIVHSPRQVQIDAAVAGPLFMLSAALLFTVMNLLVKLLGPEYSVWHIGFYRFLGGLVIIWTLFGRHRNPYRGNNIRLLIIRGCVGSVAFICVVTAIRLIPVSAALVIFYTFPAFAAIFSFLLYGERVGKLEVACIAAAMVGVGVLFDFTLAGGLFGQTMALVGGAFAGLTVTLIKTLREKNGPVVIYFYLCTMGALVTLPKFALQPVWPTTPMGVVMILGIIFASLAAQLLMNQGFFYCKGWEGGVLMSSEIVFTAVTGILFLGDPTTPRFWIGGLTIFASVVALNRLKGKQEKQ